MELAVPLVLLAGLFSVTSDDGAQPQYDVDDDRVSTDLNPPLTREMDADPISTTDGFTSGNKRAKWIPRPMPNGRAPNQAIVNKTRWLSHNKKRRPNVAVTDTNDIETISDGAYTAPLYNDFSKHLSGGGSKEVPRLDASDHVLGYKIGSSSDDIHIRAKDRNTTPLFKYDANSNLAHSNDPAAYEIDEERAVLSNIHNDRSSVEQVRVGPTDTRSGFNHGMNSVRNDEVRTVDDMRSMINKKITYSLDGLEGAPSAAIKAGVSSGTAGVSVMLRPDSTHIKNSSDWVAGGGIESAPTHHGLQVDRNLRRVGTETSYVGGASSTFMHDNTLGGISAHYTPSTRQGKLMPPSAVGAVSAAGRGNSGNNIYSISDGRAIRQESKDTSFVGSIYNSTIGALLPLLGAGEHVQKPTHREDLILVNRLGNLNPLSHKLNERNVMVRPTMRELTMRNQDGDTRFVGVREKQYLANDMPLRATQRETTISSYVGGAGNGVYTHEMLHNREHAPNTSRGLSEYGYQACGNRSTFDPDAVSQLKQSQRMDISPADMWLAPARVSDMNPYDSGMERASEYDLRKADVVNQTNLIDPQLFDALKNNPYTHTIAYT